MATPRSSGLTIVVLNSYCHAQGGASRVAIDEAIGLANKGAHVIFVGAVGPVCDELLKAPLKVVCLEQVDLAAGSTRPGVMLQGLWNLTAYRVLAGVLRGLDPRSTIVHLHGFTQALSTSPVRCAVENGFRVVYTLHDFFVACPTGAYFDFAAKTVCGRQGMSLGCIRTNCDKRNYAHKLYRVARSGVQLQFGRLPRGVKDYISLSRRSENILRRYLPSDARVYSLENPIHVSRGPLVDVASNDRIVAVGRLDPEKGIDVLLAAAAQTKSALTLIGDGPLRRRAEDSGLVHVTGWLSRDAVLSELEKARCLVFPSLWYETYGLVVAEAAARGIPAIVSSQSAAAERVEDGVTGWHVRAGDVEDLARLLRLVAEDVTVRAAGQAAYERFWSDPPTLTRHISSLEDVYRGMLGDPERE